MKYKALILSTIIVIASCGNNKGFEKQYSTPQMMVYKNNTQLDNNGWRLKSSIPVNDTCSVMKFIYRDEIRFSIDSIFCMAVFENSKGTKYKLIAPWLGAGTVIQKSNLLLEKSLVVSKEEMKIVKYQELK